MFIASRSFLALALKKLVPRFFCFRSLCSSLRARSSRLRGKTGSSFLFRNNKSFVPPLLLFLLSVSSSFRLCSVSRLRSFLRLSASACARYLSPKTSHGSPSSSFARTLSAPSPTVVVGFLRAFSSFLRLSVPVCSSASVQLANVIAGAGSSSASVRASFLVAPEFRNA